MLLVSVMSLISFGIESTVEAEALLARSLRVARHHAVDRLERRHTHHLHGVNHRTRGPVAIRPTRHPTHTPAPPH
eukprot:5069644-Prymnesium_polylepis.1